MIRGEKVWNVGREDAQKARKSESDFVTETTALGHRGGRRRAKDRKAGGGRPTEHTEHTEGFEQEKTERTEVGRRQIGQVGRPLRGRRSGGGAR